MGWNIMEGTTTTDLWTEKNTFCTGRNDNLIDGFKQWSAGIGDMLIGKFEGKKREVSSGANNSNKKSKFPQWEMNGDQ